ncbi:MAG: hypothetical protein AB1632_00130 [Nitrospirota bacterium]
MKKNSNFKIRISNLIFVRNDGIALIMVLWITVMLSIIAVNFLISTRWNSASTHNLKEETLSYYLAMSGYHKVLNYLMSDKDPSFDFIDNDGNFRTDSDATPLTGRMSTDEGEIEIRITDENSRININFSNQERLRKLFEYAGIPQDSITEIIDSILDWKDPDNEHHLSGAEDDYYENIPEPYKAKNALFDVPEELGLVKGIKTDFMRGSEEIRSLLPLITTFGRGQININTVSKDTMQLLGLNEIEIEAVLKQRNSDAGGFRFIPQQFIPYGLNMISSNTLRVEVTGTAKNSKLSAKITAVLDRRMSPKGYKIKTVYWRESAENTGG